MKAIFTGGTPLIGMAEEEGIERITLDCAPFQIIPFFFKPSVVKKRAPRLN